MDFALEYTEDIIIAKVIMRRATFLEALQFQKMLTQEIDNGYRRIIVDLTHCSSIDPAFFSAILIAYKKLLNLNGNIKIIKPNNYFDDYEKFETYLRVFEIFNSKQEAIDSYKIIFTNPVNEALSSVQIATQS
ncbi:MAG: STAS domain-containing protein [Ignavibacteriaceae bacterium]|jgi:anti-anti-sigma regulatory factor